MAGNRGPGKVPEVVYVDPLQQRPGHQGQQQLWSIAGVRSLHYRCCELQKVSKPFGTQKTLGKSQALDTELFILMEFGFA